MNQGIVVYACDAGSVSKGNFHWVSSRHRDKVSNSIELMAKQVIQDVSNGLQVALGFECVLFFPCTTDPQNLGKARLGECTRETGNKPFTASAGACATMSGLPAVGWLLREIKTKTQQSIGTTVWNEFVNESANVFLWEAFVSGYEKGDTHHEDALLALEAFERAIPIMDQATTVTAEQPVSFAGNMLLWSGLSEDVSLLHKPVVVLRPTVEPQEIDRRIALAMELRRIKREEKARQS